MDEYKNPISVRGDHLTCPLALSLEVYWTCDADCMHCMARRLNKVWGNAQKVTNFSNLEIKLKKALLNKNPKTFLAQALKNKKAFYIGRKADPYQPIEMEIKATRGVLELLQRLDWPAVVCTKYMGNLQRDFDILFGQKKLVILTEITPGGDSDWEVFEFKKTDAIDTRLRVLRLLKDSGTVVGVRGEPFIAGYHTTEQFRDLLKRIKSHGFDSFNTYMLHMNEHTIKRLYKAGLDIERIWMFNQDNYWGRIQKRLCQIADSEGVKLGCPDFVNTPPGWKTRTNTCCGVDVENCFTFNTHHWQNLILNNVEYEKIIANTWEGIGCTDDISKAMVILSGESKEFYTMKDRK